MVGPTVSIFDILDLCMSLIFPSKVLFGYNSPLAAHGELSKNMYNPISSARIRPGSSSGHT